MHREIVVEKVNIIAASVKSAKVNRFHFESSSRDSEHIQLQDSATLDTYCSAVTQFMNWLRYCRVLWVYMRAA